MVKLTLSLENKGKYIKTYYSLDPPFPAAVLRDYTTCDSKPYTNPHGSTTPQNAHLPQLQNLIMLSLIFQLRHPKWISCIVSCGVMLEVMETCSCFSQEPHCSQAADVRTTDLWFSLFI